MVICSPPVIGALGLSLVGTAVAHYAVKGPDTVRIFVIEGAKK